MIVFGFKFESLSGQTKDYGFAICCVCAKYAALRSKILPSNCWFREPVLQKIELSVLVENKEEIIIISSITHLTLNSTH